MNGQDCLQMLREIKDVAFATVDKRGCPQQCIIEETPYKIKQNHCLHCGRCFEDCPVQAIRKRG